MKPTCADYAHCNKKDYRYMKLSNWQKNCNDGTKTATTAASAPNAANGKTANAPKAASPCRTSCSDMTAWIFVDRVLPRSRKYLLGEVMA